MCGLRRLFPRSTLDAGSARQRSLSISGIVATNITTKKQTNTGSVTSMEGMFCNASSFNGDVSQWNTGSVTNMEGMFCNASSFNVDHVSGWDLNALNHARADMFTDF